ncbi:MAG TPA: hypothetical protein VIC34_01480 [Croceibacterium sp.]|jgi:hypothetical protein
MDLITDDLMLSLLMLAAIALIVGAIVRWRREGFVRHVWLMLIAAAVMLANVAIWAIPGDDMNAPDTASGAG